MKRIPEPELMNAPEQAAVYAGTDLDNSYWLFEQCFRKFLPGLGPKNTILDLGCGPAALALRLARRFPDCEIHGVDGAQQMLTLGRKSIQRAGLEQQVTLIQGILPDSLNLPRNRYEVLISNSFLHHLADPMNLWHGVLAHGLPNAGVLIIDLLRPHNEEQARRITNSYLPDAPSILHRDMMHSLRAAFTMDEVASQLQAANLKQTLSLTMASPFQFAVYGKLAGAASDL